MKVYGVPRESLESAAAYRKMKLINIRENEKYIEFKLRPTDYDWTYRKNGRLIRSVCWHGYKEFIAAIYRGYPFAKVKSAQAYFTSQHDFNERVDSIKKFSEQECGCR